MAAEQRTERAQSELGGRLIASGKRQLEGQFRQPVGGRDVAQTPATRQRAEGGLHRQQQGVDEEVGGTSAPGVRAIAMATALRSSAARGSARWVDGLEHRMDQGSELHSNGKVLHGETRPEGSSSVTAAVVPSGPRSMICAGRATSSGSTSTHRLPLLARARSRHPPARGPTREQRRSARSTTSVATADQESGRRSVAGPGEVRSTGGRHATGARGSSVSTKKSGLQPVKSLRVTGQGIAGGGLRASRGRPVQVTAGGPMPACCGTAPTTSPPGTPALVSAT